MKKYKIYFTVIVFLFNCSALFGQKGIDCGFLEQVLTEPYLSGYFSLSYYDTIYVYKENSIKYFTNCDLSHIGTKQVYILKRESPQKNDTINWNRFLLISSVRTKGKNIEIVIKNSKVPSCLVQMTYRRKRGKYKLVGYIES